MTRKLALLAGLLFLPTVAFATWTTNGPFGGNVQALVAAPSQPRTLYAGGPAGVFRSDDAGATWRPVAAANSGVVAIAVSPADPDVIVVGGAAGVSRADRNGAKVVAPAGTGISRIYFDPNDANVVYYGAHCGAIFKGDPQAEWHESAGMYKSVDGGQTFARVNSGLESFALCIEELSLDPKLSGFLYTSAIYSEGGQSRSIDAAAIWDRTPGPVPAGAIVAHPLYPTVRYGFTSHFRNYILSSNDNGFTWTVVHEFPQNGVTHPTALQIDRATGRLYLGTSNGAFRSGDGGRSWAQITPLPGNIPILALVWVEAEQTLVAATTQGLYRSVFPFATWTQPELQDASTNIDTIAIDPTNPSTIYAGTYDRYSTMRLGRVFRSTDHGGHWEPISPEQLDRGTLTVDGGGTLYAAARYGRGIWRRAAGDSAWERLEMPGDLFDIAADPARAGVVWLGGSQALYRSGDGGRSWTLVASGSSATQKIAVASDAVYWTTTQSMFRVTPDGASTTRLPLDTVGTFVAAAPSNPSIVYVVGHTLGSAQFVAGRSTDHGATWAYVNFPVADIPTGLAVDPHDANRVWVSMTNSGVYRSTDGGVTFQSVLENLPKTTTAIAVDDTTVFAGTSDRGVWERPND